MDAAIIAQIAPLIPTIITTVENFFSWAKKTGAAAPTAQQKLNAAVALAAASSVAVATSLATQPQTVTHLQSVINSSVAVANTFESFDHYLQAQAASAGA